MNPATQLRQPSQPRRRRGAQILSTLLFIAAMVFAGAALYIWYIDEESPDSAPAAPTATPGLNTLADVLAAFKDAGLDGDYGRSPATVKSNQMSPPGQHLIIEDQSVYVFIFPSGDAQSAAAAREEAARSLDPATMTLTTPSGQSFGEGETLTVSEGSNVIAVLVGGDEELQARVRDVIEGLP
jgi:hypothetical protein